jgi:hypothetical protein
MPPTDGTYLRVAIGGTRFEALPFLNVALGSAPSVKATAATPWALRQCVAAGPAPAPWLARHCANTRARVAVHGNHQ